MLRFTLPLLLLSAFTFNTQASGIPPQQTPTGTDGVFELLNGSSTLFGNTDNIYNFVDFNIANGSTLNINNNGPVYIYSEQSITISGALINNSPDLHLIAQTFNLSGNITSNSGDMLLANSSSNFAAADLSNGSIISGNSDITLTTGVNVTRTASLDAILIVADNPNLTPVFSDPITVISPITIISPSPVPVPAALWLMISGILSIGLLTRLQQANPTAPGK